MKEERRSDAFPWINGADVVGIVSGLAFGEVVLTRDGPGVALVRGRVDENKAGADLLGFLSAPGLPFGLT